MKSARQLCIAILIVTAIAALSIGYMLISDNSGHSLQLSFDDLKGSPFANYSLPGWIILIAIGVFSTVAAFVSFRHDKIYPYLIMAVGSIMLLFVVGEIYIIQQFQLLQLMFGLIAVALLLLGNLIRKNLKMVADHSDHNPSSAKHPQKKSHYHKHRKRGH